VRDPDRSYSWNYAMNAVAFLSMLHGVRRYGTGWRANCPNQHQKTRGSLSITEADDGRVMLHCFACGDTPSILRALGLEMAALFPHRVIDPSPEGRKVSVEAFKHNAWGAALGVLNREATVVHMAATDMQAGKPLSQADVRRLGLAAERVAQAREVLR
jgi:hypothetical protein